MLSRVFQSAAQTGCRRSSRDVSLIVGKASAVSITSRRPQSSSAAESPSEASTSSSKYSYAIVDHSDAYQSSMKGPHGKQLELAQLDGMGKDNPPFNPFWDDDDYDDEDIIEGDESDVDDDDDEDEIEDADSPYNNDGSLRWSKAQLATFRAGAPAGGVFAVVELAGSQHKVTLDDLLVVNLLKPVGHYKVGSTHTLTDVMLVGSSHHTLVGMPHVSGAEVDVMVEEITQDEKVIVFKKKRRKNYKRKKGYRRDLTFLRVLDIRPPAEVGDSFQQHVPRQEPLGIS